MTQQETTTSPLPVARLKAHSVGIIGAGVVGEATGEALRVAPVVFHDPPAGKDGRPRIALCTIVFVCVPTPHDEELGTDLSAVRDALTYCSEGTVVVIRSTMLPGCTELLQAENPELALMHVPEFLTEATASEDARRPERQLFGYTKQSKPHVKLVEALLPKAPFSAYVTAREAEAVKVMANAFYALKVSFANQFFDYCEAVGIFYGMVRECAGADPMIADEHLDINHGAKRGFGGKCLPKDTRALLLASESAGAPMTLLREALAYNEELRRCPSTD